MRITCCAFVSPVLSRLGPRTMLCMARESLTPNTISFLCAVHGAPFDLDFLLILLLLLLFSSSSQMGVPAAKGALQRYYRSHFKTGHPPNVNFLIMELLPQLRCHPEEYATSQLIDLLLREYAMFFRHPDHTFAAVVADDSKYVPKRKAETQAARLQAWSKSAARKGQVANEPYPEGSKLVPSGVLVDEKLNLVQKLTVDRLCFSRPLRKKFFEMLYERALTYPMPSHAFLLFDVGLEAGPMLIHMNKAWSWRHVAKPIGEGEMIAMYWTRFMLESFGNAHVMLKTVDTDILPIAFHMYSQDTSRPFNVSWVHLGDQYVNLKQLFDSMLELHVHKACAWSSRSFSAACALSGSDYTNKADLLAGIGPDCVFDAALEAGQSKEGKEAKTEEEFFRLVLTRVYKKKNKSTAPMEDTKADAYRYALDEYTWLISYWRALGHGEIDLGPGLRQRENKPVAPKSKATSKRTTGKQSATQETALQQLMRQPPDLDLDRDAMLFDA